MSRSFLDLKPHAKDKFAEWLRLCSGRGVAVLVYTTFRSEAEQERLYAIGRDEDGKRIPGGGVVTFARAGQSEHQLGLAVDAVPWGTETVERGKLDWTPFDSAPNEREFRRTGRLELLDHDWAVMVKAADKLGIQWAGRWSRFIEYCHFSVQEEASDTDP